MNAVHGGGLDDSTHPRSGLLNNNASDEGKWDTSI